MANCKDFWAPLAWWYPGFNHLPLPSSRTRCVNKLTDFFQNTQLFTQCISMLYTEKFYCAIMFGFCRFGHICDECDWIHWPPLILFIEQNSGQSNQSHLSHINSCLNAISIQYWVRTTVLGICDVPFMLMGQDRSPYCIFFQLSGDCFISEYLSELSNIIFLAVFRYHSFQSFRNSYFLDLANFYKEVVCWYRLEMYRFTDPDRNRQPIHTF